MNFNILAYIIYGGLMTAVIVKVGLICYRNGDIYISNMMPNNLDLCHLINKILLVGYYLVNLGYSVYMVSTWSIINSPHEVVAQIAGHSGKIILLLALLHYGNMVGIQLLFNKQSLSKF